MRALAWWVVLAHFHVNIATPRGWSSLGSDLDCNALVSYRAGDERVR